MRAEEARLSYRLRAREIVLHRFPSHDLEEFRGAGVEAGCVAEAFRRFLEQGRIDGASRQIGTGEARMALVGRVQDQLGPLPERARERQPGRDYEGVVVVCGLGRGL